MKIKYSEDLPIHEVPSLPSSVPAILYQGTVLVCKSCANELLQMGFGSMFGSGIVVQANPNEDLQLRPNPSNYSLVLHDEEALYLLEVGVLKIIPHSSSSTTLDVSTVSYTVLLQLFTSKRANFPLNYKVYCYFKFRGFVVRPGMNFGMDFSIYRLNPTKCHSEICVQVIDARNNQTHVDTLLSWRNISTLTRVMPDVMKVCTLCFVCNNNEVQNVNTSLVTDSLGTSSSCDYLKLLDSVEENSCGPEITENFVKNLIVKPVSVAIRRLSVNAEKYLSISQIQSKYRASSKLHMPRSTVRSTKVQTLKVNKKRRNHLEVRTKNTKTATVWKVLDQESIEVNDKIEEHM